MNASSRNRGKGENRTLELTSVTTSQRQLAYTARVGGLRFGTSVWYDSVDFAALASTFGESFVRRVVFHIVAFDINKLLSLKPDRVDFGPFADLVTEAFAALWQRIADGVWAQWRYENDLPGYRAPVPPAAQSDAHGEPIVIQRGTPDVLAFCGGGKDSLVALRVLEEAGIAYDTLAYAHSVYGTAEPQHRLIDNLVAHAHPLHRRRMWMFDDFMDAPVLGLQPDLGLKSITAAETPTSVFASIPLALAQGYTAFVLAHERSADMGNLVWSATGETVNHQWGKSLEAEGLVADYIRNELIENLDYFSVLKPIRDPVIFASLQQDLEALRQTHSCNVAKPWCKRCPKCCYVWLNYMAYLPTNVINEMFGENLFDVDENQIWFRQMLGLEAHTPFECVGQVDETRLAFELCHRRGLEGRAMRAYRKAYRAGIALSDVSDALEVATDNHRIPNRFVAGILAVLERRCNAARGYVAERL